NFKNGIVVKALIRKKSTENPYKRKKLDNYENNDLTEKMKQILYFHLNNSISKESNEINNCKKAYPKDSSERNIDQIDYSEENKEESFYQPEASLRMAVSRSYGNNPSVLIYGEQLTHKSENGKSTANLIDNSVLNNLQTIKNIENSESLKKALDLTELIKLII
ncbi:37635_t:CDS:2, partial [Gigaspora margarita]